MTVRSPVSWAILALVCVCFSGVTFAIVRLDHVANEAKAAARQAQVASRQAKAASARSTRSLCSIRAAAEQQVHSTAVYLRKHPDGVPALHLSRAAILRSEALLVAQIKALRDVRCPQ